ncbi:uncharacterized protein [Panulirus ornatus]|uniref:uncharacterized protein isoform X2 n=1 Tax=Panulirus ornatus TaxID=150431 RepID=UPI003A83EA95
MKERDKAQKPSGGPEKSRSKTSTSKTSSSKTSTSSSKSSSSAPKASSSKTHSSSTKSSSNSKTTSSKTSLSTKTSSSTSKKPSSTNSSSTKGLSSSSKTSSSTSKASSSTSRTHSTSSRPAKTTAASTSKTHTTEKPGPGSTKTTSSGSRGIRGEHANSNREDKSRRNKEPSRGDIVENGALKGKKLSSNPIKGDHASSSQSRREKVVNDDVRSDKKGAKSSTNRERAPDNSKKHRSQRVEHPTTQKEPGSSRRSNEQHNKGRISSDKSRTEKQSQKEIEKVRDKSRPKKEEQTREERSKNKSSRSREKSSTNAQSPIKNEADARDSGVEGMSMGPVTVSRASDGQEMEVIEHTQNSLETMESGISMSSPRDLSGDEVDVEESISSKMVEVDEVEEEEMQKGTAMIDDESLSLRDMGGEYSASQFQNVGVVSTELPFDEVEEENDVEEEADYDYEEDFEDYESDFEDDSGSGSDEEEEDSEDDSVDDDSDAGTPDPEIAAVLQAIQEENNFENHIQSTIQEENTFENHLQRTFSMDVPDQDERSLSPEKSILRAEAVQEHQEEPKMPEESHSPVSRPKTSRTFVNFAQARKKQIAAQLSSQITSRGRVLLNMIQLDTVSVDLLTLTPISYEAYISSFGHSNRQQIHVQTNEDALCEEVQTDEIVTRNKWTQKPIHISIGKDNQLPMPEDYIGVGGDMDPFEHSRISSSNNTAKLTSFLTSSSQVMLAILEEELIWDLAESDNATSSTAAIEGLGFSHPPVPLGANVKSLLEHRLIPFVQFCATESTMLLTGHGYKPLDEGDRGELNESGLLCIWSVQEPSRPQYLLCCRASPTAATFSPSRPSLVLSGLEDGSLAAWDLREQLHFHTLKIEIEDVNWRVRVPSYITACDEEGDGEGSTIVAIQTVTTQQDLEVDTPGSFQVVTLTSDGKVTWWVVVRVPLTGAVADIGISRRHTGYSGDEGGVGVSPHLGAAPWARIALNRAATINVATTLYGETPLVGGINCHSLRLDPSDTSQLFVATGSGTVARCSRHASRIHPKSYVPEIEPGCEALCLALCPHDSRYLLVGGGDGIVRLHSTETDRPLTSWQSAPDSSPIVDLQWSPARPCVFYVLDSHARLHVWDLSAGDIFPVLTVEAGGLVGSNLCAFSIAPTQITSRHPLLSVFASDEGELILRQVSPEFCTYELVEDYNTELERFTYYVNII